MCVAAVPVLAEHVVVGQPLGLELMDHLCHPDVRVVPPRGAGRCLDADKLPQECRAGRPCPG